MMKQYHINAANSPYLGEADRFYVVDTTDGAVQINLTGLYAQGDRIEFKHRRGANDLEINGLIDGVSQVVSLDAGCYWSLEFDGTEWMIK